MKRFFIIFLICIFLAPSVLAEPAESASGSVKFSDGKASRVISVSGEQLIPIDYEGMDIFDLKIKSSNEKIMLHNLDRDGVHIVPMAAGKANLTITSRSDKKAKLDVEVTVEDSAVANLDEGPLTAYVMADYSYILPTDKPVLRYFICGGKKPYSSATIIPMVESEQTMGVHQEIKKPKSTGKANLRFDTGTKSIALEIKVVDADLNMIETQGTGILVKHSLSVMPAFIPFKSPVNVPIEIPYTITGGSGKYSVTQTMRLRKEYTDLFENTTKFNSTGEGTISYTPTVEGCFGYRLKIQDQKTKEIIYYDPIGTEITQDESVIGVYDKATVHTGEPVTITMTYSKAPEKPPELTVSARMREKRIVRMTGIDFSSTDNDERVIAFSKEIEKVDDCTYRVIFTPFLEGNFYFLMVSEGLLQHYGSIINHIQVLD